MAEATITAKQLAQEAGTDPKTFRRFLRSHLRGQDLETPGQGGRYAFTKSEAKRLVKAFTAWSAPKVKVPAEASSPAELSDADLEEFDIDMEDSPDEEADDDAEDDEDEDTDGD